MADTYERGTMDVSSKLRTYRAFIGGVRLVAFSFAVIISFLIVTFCGGGFGAGLVVTIVELAIGVYAARNRWRSVADTAEQAAGGASEAQLQQAANRNTPDQHAA